MDGGSNARTCWTEETTAYFIQLLQEQVRKCPRGNIMMGNLALRKQAWEHLTSLFVQKYGVHYQTSILKNRFNSLRKKYNDINTLLNNGFQWDRARHLVVADDDNVWNTYIKAHPNARSYRTNSTPLYDDLCVIYGGSPVDDKLNDTGEEEMEDDFSVEIPATDKDTADWIENCLHDEEEAVRQEEEKGEEEDPPFLVRMSRETPAIEENTDDDIENLEEGCSSETFKKHNEDLLSVQKGSTNEGSLKVSVYRSRVTWTTSMDRDFIFLMKNHVQQGNRTKRTFVSEAWMDMVEQLSQKFGPQCDKDALYNRFKTLRKHHSCVQSLLCHDGFEWDETLQMVKGDVHVWDKAYPHSKQYRVSPVPFFKDLCIIFGDTYITGRNNNLGGDPVHNLQEDSSYLNGDIPNQHNKRILKSPLDSRYSEKLKNTDQSVIDVSHEMGSAKLGVVQIDTNGLQNEEKDYELSQKQTLVDKEHRSNHYLQEAPKVPIEEIRDKDDNISVETLDDWCIEDCEFSEEEECNSFENTFPPIPLPESSVDLCNDMQTSSDLSSVPPVPELKKGDECGKGDIQGSGGVEAVECNAFENTFPPIPPPKSSDLCNDMQTSSDLSSVPPVPELKKGDECVKGDIQGDEGVETVECNAFEDMFHSCSEFSFVLPDLDCEVTDMEWLSTFVDDSMSAGDITVGIDFSDNNKKDDSATVLQNGSSSCSGGMTMPSSSSCSGGMTMPLSADTVVLDSCAHDQQFSVNNPLQI